MSTTASEENDAVACAACGKQSKSLKTCTGCRLVKYCHRACQAAHRKVHKTACKKAAHDRAAAAAAVAPTAVAGGGKTETIAARGRRKSEEEAGFHDDDWVPTRLDSEDKLDLTVDGLLQKIETNDPTITSVEALWGIATRTESSGVNATSIRPGFEWEIAGRFVGKNSHLKHVVIRVDRPLFSNMAHLDNWVDTDELDIISFCRGLSLNRSIQKIELIFRRNLPFIRDVFEELIPLFRGNSNIRHLKVTFRDEALSPAVRNLSRAIEASTSLRCINLASAYKGPPNLRPRNVLDGALLRSVGTRPLLSHLVIKRMRIEKSGSIEIKNILCDESCKLTSFRLKGHSPLKVFQKDCRPRMNVKNKRWDELNISRLPYESNYALGYEIIQALGSFPMLKKLNLQGQDHIDSEAWKRIFQTLLHRHPSSTLQELNICFCSVDDESIKELAAGLSLSPALKVLNLYGNDQVSPAGWEWFFNSDWMIYSFLEQLDIGRNNTGSVEVASAFAKRLKANTTLEVLFLSSCDKISTEGCEFLFSALSQSRVKKLTLSEDDALIETLSWELKQGHLTGLKHLEFVNISGQGIEILTNALSWNCQLQLEVLVLSAEISDWEDSEDFDQWDSESDESGVQYVEHDFTTTLMNLMSSSNRWKELRIDLTSNALTVLVQWSMVENWLCDKSSIDATYTSDHSLQVLELKSNDCGLNMPIDIYSLLQMNRGCIKSAVARRKILRVHFNDDLTMEKLEEKNIGDLKMLPHVLSWMGKEDAELSVIYCFLRQVPSFLRKNVS
ncbi:hypothetical protein ACHAW6_007066 [Cyclotella cf. meneghiniana]